ncbi:MAG: hypothetical protein KDA61_03810 [Planctomycetales bacterium]|nr:hypothetical protein [Planctomycetales bacterium]
MTIRRALRLLVTLVLGLPVALAVLMSIARGLLAALGDERGTAAIDGVVRGLGVCWILCLVALIVVLGLHALQQTSADEG